MSGHLILGKDVANNKYVPISVDSSGHLDIDVQVADLDSKMMASETGATDGQQRQARCDTDGHLQVDVVSMTGGGDATAANQTTQITNQGTINTSLGTVNTSVGTVNSTLGDTNSKIDAMRGTSDLGVINTSLGTVNTSIGTSNSTLTDIEAHQGNIENNLSSIQSTVSSNKLQVDVISNADTTRATSTNQSTMITSLASLAGCVSGTELQVDIVSGGGGGGGGDASAANQTTMINHLSEIEGAVETIEGCVGGTELQCDIVSSALPSGAATEATLSAAEVHLGNIDTQTSSIQSNVSTSSNQTTMITHLSEIEGAVETVEACVSSNRLAVDTNNATHGTLAQLSVATGASGVNSAILNTEGYSKLVMVVKNSTNTSSSISASLLWSDSATFSGGADLVMSSEDLTGGAFSPIFFSLAVSADGTTYSAPQGLFSLSPPAQYCRVNVFHGTGSTLAMDFNYILSR